jgi:hypothetical protein
VLVSRTEPSGAGPVSLAVVLASVNGASGAAASRFGGLVVPPPGPLSLSGGGWLLLLLHAASQSVSPAAETAESAIAMDAPTGWHLARIMFPFSALTRTARRST